MKILRDYQTEIWKTIEEFNNYEISSFGSVRRKNIQIVYSNGIITNYKEKLLNQEIVKGNYKRVTLSQKNIQKRLPVHRLVAHYFIENLENKPCVNHIDGNKFNNNVLNLEWCTYSENEIHSYNILGKVNPIRKLIDNEVLDIRENCVKGINGCVILFMKKYNVSRKTILNVLNKKYYA